MSKSIRDMKICISGAQGSGKTTLMTAFSERYDVPIVRVSTTDLMPEGISSHKDVIKLSANNIEEGVKFQERLIKNRAQKFLAVKHGFISDRSTIDSLAYFSVHNACFLNDMSLTEELVEIVRKSTKSMDLTIFLKPYLDKVEDNNIRVSNLLYYDSISAIIYSITSGIMQSDVNNTEESTFSVNNYMRGFLVKTNNTAFLFINEEAYPMGIGPTEDRLECIEKTLDLL